jgi:hypothetical protein
MHITENTLLIVTIVSITAFILLIFCYLLEYFFEYEDDAKVDDLEAARPLLTEHNLRVYQTLISTTNRDIESWAVLNYESDSEESSESSESSESDEDSMSM